MWALVPLVMTDAILTSSSVPEPDASTGEVVWDSGTSYGAGAQVISTTTHWIWESAQAGNLNHALPAAGESDTWWLSVGPTNRWKTFDAYRNTKTVADSPYTIVLTPGQRIRTLFLGGIVADEVVVTVTRPSSSGPIYTATRTLRTRTATNWWDWFFSPFRQFRYVWLNDLPGFRDQVITITLTRSSGQVQLGSLLIGSAVYIGIAEANAVSDAQNFSTINRDIEGNAQLIPRRTIPKINVRVVVERANVDNLLHLREEANAVPTVWCCLDDVGHGYFGATLILGPYKQFSIDLGHPDARATIEAEEV